MQKLSVMSSMLPSSSIVVHSTCLASFAWTAFQHVPGEKIYIYIIIVLIALTFRLIEHFYFLINHRALDSFLYIIPWGAQT